MPQIKTLRRKLGREYNELTGVPNQETAYPRKIGAHNLAHLEMSSISPYLSPTDAGTNHRRLLEVVMDNDVHGAFSVGEWCQHRGICPATFYNRLPHGEMPATVKVGRRRIITVEADKEWRRRMERFAEPKEPLSGDRA
jgi:hypothetical protein